MRKPDPDRDGTADTPAAGGKDSDTGTTEYIGAAPAERLEIQAIAYTQEAAQWLTSLTSKASADGVILPTILIEMCPLTLSYEQDGSGARSSDKGLLLIPAPAPGGNAGNVSASGGNMPNDPFEKSATFRDAVLVDLESPREFFNVSRKFSMDCRRSQASGWKTEGLTSTSAEVARANIRTHIGEAFLARELVVPGLEPVKAPQTMATGITKAGVEKFLPTPMAQLNLAADGKLAIPTEQELKDNPLVSLTPELLSYFEKLRVEFSQSTSPGPAAGGRSEPPPLPLPPTKPGAPILSVGETVGNRTDLHGLLRTSGPTSKIHKEVQQNGEWVFCLSKWRTRRHRTVSS